MQKQRRSTTNKQHNNDELVVPQNMPLLDAICKTRNQRIDKTDEHAVLAMYERNWILKDRVSSLGKAESGYLRKLAKKNRSWLANQI